MCYCSLNIINNTQNNIHNKIKNNFSVKNCIEKYYGVIITNVILNKEKVNLC